MIVVSIKGGHSNQMFQYATARALSAKLNTKLLLDLEWFDNIPEEDTKRFYELGDYNLSAEIADMSKLTLDAKLSSLQKIKHSLTGKTNLTVYTEKSAKFDPDLLSQSDNTYLNGFWQCQDYFNNIRNQLLTEFEPKTPMTPKNIDYLKQIQGSQTVSIHVRRGDYVTNQHANKFHGVKGAEYYLDAYNLLVSKTGNKKLVPVIFSNDIDWCKQNLKFPVSPIFAEGNINGADDMRLMKYCQHNICANSSFSWWGAWLNQNPDKIIIAPKMWFEDKTANDATDIVPNNWIRI